MTIQSILVATDLSVQENGAVLRARQLADAHRASMKLMYMPPQGHKPAADATLRLGALAMQLEEDLALRVRTVPVKAHKPEDLVAEARGTHLVVLPHRRERSTAAFFRGQPVVRILRDASCPVLVTRHGGELPYRHILVAVDFSPASEGLVRLAADLDARAALELFHAIDTLGEAKLRSAEATEQAVRAYRERCLRDARQRMLTLTDSYVARRNRLLAALGRGDPGRQTVIQQEHSEADLVVVGKRRSSAWEDFFCGSVAHRVLSWGSSDVLVVPHGFVPATAPAAAQRMRGTHPQPALRMQPAGRRNA
ncbi:universal stress protein [Ramlibacter sp. USB13]|uniref:Universal stress protein n=1 Tax=Ramlibacter cellulosilyticus TaxID=2764187 RepID=A0A923SG59_9BURK|nr:universal stress protein [Ramlibacter cellulosilyticus]MBC5784602.1 universal stress protein [Ramlibacter cellulosilyticus]